MTWRPRIASGGTRVATFRLQHSPPVFLSEPVFCPSKVGRVQSQCFGLFWRSKFQTQGEIPIPMEPFPTTNLCFLFFVIDSGLHSGPKVGFSQLCNHKPKFCCEGFFEFLIKFGSQKCLRFIGLVVFFSSFPIFRFFSKIADKSPQSAKECSS